MIMRNLTPQVLPEQLNYVQLRRIGWQLTHLEPIRVAFQHPIGGFATMDNEIVNYQHDLRAIPGFASAVACNNPVEQRTEAVAILPFTD